MERLSNKFNLMELDHTRYNHAFEGVTKADVEGMLRYKVEKEDVDLLLKNLND